MAMVSTTDAVSLTKKKARPKTITKKGPGIFVECGKVRLGKSEDWFKVGNLGMQIFKSEPPQIGLWGIVKNGNKSLKEIAAQVYGDASKVRFIMDANKIYKDIAFEGQQLYIPNLTYNRLQKQNELVNSNYYFTQVDLSSNKPIMQIAGDVYVTTISAYVNQYYYAGTDNNSRLVASETITYKEFHHQMVKIVNEINNNHGDTYGTTAIDTGKALKNRNELKYLKTRVEKGGKLSFRIDKNLKVLDCEPTWGRWIGYGDFAKRVFKGAFSKGAVIFSVIVAGIKTYLDWEKNRNPKHALITMGKEVVKAGVSMAAGAGLAALFALFLPGPGWVVAGLIIGGALMGILLDSIDESTERYQKKWAY